MGKRRKYSAEFKREAVALADDPSVTQSQIAQELGISDATCWDVGVEK